MCVNSISVDLDFYQMDFHFVSLSTKSPLPVEPTL